MSVYLINAVPLVLGVVLMVTGWLLARYNSATGAITLRQWYQAQSV